MQLAAFQPFEERAAGLVMLVQDRRAGQSQFNPTHKSAPKKNRPFIRSGSLVFGGLVDYFFAFFAFLALAA